MNQKQREALRLVNDMIAVMVKDRAKGIESQPTEIVEGWLRMIKLKLE